jgi:Peroxiredoxin
MSLKVGDPAPEFALPDQTGDVVRLADLRGRRVVLYFYPKADTPDFAHI